MKIFRIRSNYWLILGFIFCLLLLFVFYISHQLKQIKEPLIAFLKKQVQGDIQITRVEASLFPPGIRLENVLLYAPGETEAAAIIQEADLSFKIFPLLSKHIDTKIYIQRPQIRLVLDTDGKNNFEKIFAPLLSKQNSNPSKLSEKVWWERLSVSKLVIEDAQFKSSEARNATPTEIQNLNVEANDLSLENSKDPARIKIEFDLPRLSKDSVEIHVKLQNNTQKGELNFKEGKVEWGAARLLLSGVALLPQDSRKGLELNLKLQLEELDLKKFSKSFNPALELSGDLSGSGSIEGSAFSPILAMNLHSRTLKVKDNKIDRLQMSLSKKDKAIEINKAEMSAFGGAISATGTLLPEKTVSGNFWVDLKSLSLSELIKKPHPARLSGKLEVNGSDISDLRSFSGDGNVSLGPVPLPVVDLKSKMKVGEFLAEGSLLEKAFNLGFLSSSANVIGTQIDSLNANISFSEDDIVFNSYRLSNSHFSATGSGSLKNQKTLRASGTATLSSAVTAMILPDINFRSMLTGGKTSLSLPYHVAGTIDNPEFSIDSAYSKELVAKAAAGSLKKMILGDGKPQDLINSVLQESPLGKNLPSVSPNSSKKNSKPKTFEQFLWGK